jgi:cytoskeletal protein RodZ
VPKNEDGEFELVLGNRQLLSVFFIVVALMGVFFAIGYILGRNSGPMTSEVASSRKTDKPLVVDSPARDTNPSSTSPTSTSPSSTSPTSTSPTSTSPTSTSPTTTSSTRKTEPAPSPKPEKSKPAESAKAQTPKPEPTKTKPPEPAKPTPAAATGELASGIYLQLTATSEHEATVYIDVLRKKGFKAQSAEVPDKRGLFRVLVGPVAEGNVNKTKADLKAAGFPGDQAIKRTF